MTKKQVKKFKMSMAKNFRKGSTIQLLFNDLKSQKQFTESALEKKYKNIDLNSRLIALARRGRRVKGWDVKRKDGKVQMVVKDKALLKPVTVN